MNRFYFYGGKFMEQLSRYVGSDGVVGGMTVQVSPLSDVVVHRESGQAFNLFDMLDDAFAKSEANYLIMDLQNLVEPLLKEDSEKKNKFIQIDELGLSDKFIQNKLKKLIAVIKKYFPDENVFFIRSHLPKYYIIDTQVRESKQFKKQTDIFKFITEFEDYFIKQSQFVPIELKKYYFYKKEAGRPVTDYIFEDYCCENIFQEIKKYISGEVYSFDKPCFGFSIQRYCKYYTTDFQVAFKFFLNYTNPMEAFILDAPRHFILTHYDQLLKLYEYDWSNPEVALKNIQKSQNFTDEIKEIIAAYISMRSSIEEPEREKAPSFYRCLFQNSIVPSETLRRIRKYVIDNHVIPFRQLNKHNAGYYYAFMRGEKEDTALTFSAPKTTIAPCLIDIYGSCISRTCFREEFSNNTSIAVNHYWHTLPLCKFTPKPAPFLNNIKIDIFNELDMNVKEQLEGTIDEILINSEGKWLIVDFYYLVSPKIFQYGDSIYYDFYKKISKKLGAKNVKIMNEDTLLGDMNSILKHIKSWSNIVHEKYGNKIILVQTTSSPYQLGDNGRIYILRKKENVAKQNTFMGRACEFVQKQLNCYCIDLTKNFIADDRGYGNRAAVHYELAFYSQVFQIIKYIIETEPKQKYFDSYSPELRVSRIVRFLEKNPASVVGHYFHTELDKIVLQLPFNILQQFRDEIITWYRYNLKNKEELVNFLRCTAADKNLLDAVIQTGEMTGIEAKVKKDYPAYKKQLPIWVSLCTNLKSVKVSEKKKFILRFEKDELSINVKKLFTLIFDGDGADAGDMPEVNVVFGVKIELPENRFTRNGYKFIGWKAVRISDQKTRYKDKDGQKFWLVAPQSEEFTPLYYRDKAKIAKISAVNNDIVIMYAQWKYEE